MELWKGHLKFRSLSSYQLILFPCHLCCDLLTSLRIHFSQVLLALFLIPD